jgi:Fe-S-cluster containining protein
LPHGQFEAWLEALPEEDPCPVLDPETGTCDLYAARPVTCRIFGPPVRLGGNAVGVCELCFEGATDEEIAACEVQLDIAELEADGQQTLVALALS